MRPLIGRRESTRVRADGLKAEAKRCMPGGVPSRLHLPDAQAFVLVGAEGCYLRTADGRSLIDYAIGGGPFVLGHQHPEVMAAVDSDLRRGALNLYVHEPVIRLASELVEAIPCADRVRFTTSGSEATMFALRYARAYTGRNGIVKFRGAYHGNHDAATVSMDPGRPRTDKSGFLDSAGVDQGWLESVAIAEFNDFDSVARIFRERGESIAAVIVEPYQRFLAPARGFLEALKTICQEYGSLLIFDEIVTGFRFGRQGAQGRYGVVPDIATYGKIIGGGFPLAAVAGAADILDLSAPTKKGSADFVYHSGTLSGHSLACAAGLATLDVLARDGIYERLKWLTQRLARGLEEVLRSVGVQGVVVAETGLWHVIFADRIPQTVTDLEHADMHLLERFHLGLIDRGVFVIPGSRNFVSLAHDEQVIDRTLSLAEEALRAAISSRAE